VDAWYDADAGTGGGGARQDGLHRAGGVRLFGARELINQGVISADGAGTLTINPTQFENPGTVLADGAGASVVIRVTPFTNTGTILELNGGSVLINP